MDLIPDEQSQKYMIDAFIGYNQALDEQLLDPGATHEAQNFVIRDGILRVTPGNTKYVESQIPNGIKTLMVFFKNETNGTVTKTLLASSEDTIYKLDGQEWVSVKNGLSNGYFDYINYQHGVTEITIMGNGTDSMFKWDGTTLLKLGGNPPPMRSISLHYERVWGTCNKQEPNRVYYSAALDPENWNFTENEGGFIDLPTWDGGICIGLSTIFDDVLIFKTYNIWKIVGTYPGEYQKVQVFSSTGAIADRSIVDAGTVSFFLARDGIYVYDGVQTHYISSPIKKIIDNMNLTYADKAVGVFYDNRYILAIPEGNSTENNTIIEYDLNTKQFIIKRGFNVNSFVVFNDKLLFSNNNGYVLEYDKGDTFDGVPIEAYWYTPDTNLGLPSAIKRSTVLYCTLNKIYGDQLRIDGLFDRKSKFAIVELPSNKTDKKIKLRCSGRHMKLKISNINGSRFTLAMPQLYFDIDED